MMEDPLIEKNNGLNDMSADDGGSSHDEITDEEGSVGTNGFITPLAQYKPHDNHLGLRWRRRTNVSYSEDDQHQETHIQNDDHFPDDHSEDEEYSADDGGSSDLDETEDQGSVGSDAFITPLAQYKPDDLGLRRRRRTNLPYFDVHHHYHPVPRLMQVYTTILPTKKEPQLLKKPYDDHILPLQLTPLTKRQSPEFHFLSKFLTNVSLGGPMIDQIFQSTLKKPVALLLNKPFDDHFGLRHRRIKLSLREGTLDFISWFKDDDYLLHRLIDSVKGVDVVSQMISHPTVIAAAGTHEQRITQPSRLLMNTPHHIDIQEDSSNDEELQGWSQKMHLELIFVIINVVLESMIAVFAQLSSKQTPQYALIGVLLSYLALLTCIIEIICEGYQQIASQRGTLSNNRSQRDKTISEGDYQQIASQRGTLSALACVLGKSFAKSYATLSNIGALLCSLGECVVTTINYKHEDVIKSTVTPIILANGVLVSKIFKYWQRSSTSISSK